MCSRVCCVLSPLEWKTCTSPIMNLLSWRLFTSSYHLSESISYILFQQLTLPVSTYYLTNFICVPHPCHRFAFQVENSKYSSTVFIALQNKWAEVIKCASSTMDSSAPLWKSRSLNQCQTRFHFSAVKIVTRYEWLSSWWSWTHWHRSQCPLGKKKIKKGNGIYKKSQTPVITRHQQSTAVVPVLFGTRDQFCRRQFFQGGVGEYSLGMIQA